MTLVAKLKVLLAPFLVWSCYVGLLSSAFARTHLPTSGTIASYRGPTMGTSYLVKVRGLPPLHLEDRIDQVLGRINQSMSTYLESSEISQFNQLSSLTPHDASADFFEVALISKRIYQQTKGAFDPTLNRLVRLWGFGPDSKPIKIPSTTQLERMLQQVGYDKLRLDPASKTLQKQLKMLTLDFSAVAKGYAADEVGVLLESLGFFDYMVEVGGEVKASGTKKSGQPWVIGIEVPTAGLQQRPAKAVKLQDMGLATSGDYRNFHEIEGQRVSHILSPLTGMPIKHDLASVSVLSHSCAEADALATAFMVMGRHEARRVADRDGLAVLFIYRSGASFKTEWTPAFAPYLVN